MRETPEQIAERYADEFLKHDEQLLVDRDRLFPLLRNMIRYDRFYNRGDGA